MLAAALGAVAVPALVIRGSKDPVLGPAGAIAAHVLRAGRLAIVAGGDHLPCHRAPGATFAAIDASHSPPLILSAQDHAPRRAATRATTGSRRRRPGPSPAPSGLARWWCPPRGRGVVAPRPRSSSRSSGAPPAPAPLTSGRGARLGSTRRCAPRGSNSPVPASRQARRPEACQQRRLARVASPRSCSRCLPPAAETSAGPARASTARAGPCWPAPWPPAPAPTCRPGPRRRRRPA